MRKHAVLLAFAALLGTTGAWGAQQHPARGIVIQVGPEVDRDVPQT
jgi:hypothetical protein